MRVHREIKSDGVRNHHQKEHGVRVDHEKKSDGVKDDHKKELWGESSP